MIGINGNNDIARRAGLHRALAGEDEGLVVGFAVLQSDEDVVSRWILFGDFRRGQAKAESSAAATAEETVGKAKMLRGTID